MDSNGIKSEPGFSNVCLLTTSYIFMYLYVHVATASQLQRQPFWLCMGGRKQDSPCSVSAKCFTEASWKLPPEGVFFFKLHRKKKSLVFRFIARNVLNIHPRSFPLEIQTA